MKVAISKENIARANVVPSFALHSDWLSEDIVLGRLIISGQPCFGYPMDCVDMGSVIFVRHKEVLTMEDVYSLCAIISQYDKAGKFKHINIISKVKIDDLSEQIEQDVPKVA